MTNDQDLHSKLLRLGGITALLSGLLFFVGVVLQVSSGWFPEEALGAQEMTAWLSAVAGARGTALAGVGFSIAAIALWMPPGLALYRLLRNARPMLALVGLTGFLTGVPLALAAFSFGFGVTWGLIDTTGPVEVALSTSLMRGFLVMDDIATFLIIGVGIGFFAAASSGTGLLPRWLAIHGVVAGALVTVVLLRYEVPVFGIATLGYPLGLLWLVFVGVVLIRKSRHGVVKERDRESA